MLTLLLFILITQGSIEEWLCLLRLDEYVQSLLAQGYETVHDVTQLPWEDMEDIGIVKLGHQKKLLLAIKRVKDILSGKWVLQGGGSCNIMVSVISVLFYFQYKYICVKCELYEFSLSFYLF